MENEETNLESSENTEKAGETETPIFLGYQPNAFSIKWDYHNMSLARVGFMHPDFNHGFIKYILREFKKNKVRIIRINTNETINDKAYLDPFPLLDFEIVPTYRDYEELEESRLKWVQLYLQMICYVNGESRESFIPSMNYYKWQEGPLAGYIRAIEALPESERKQTLLKHIRKLFVIDWVTIENIEKGEMEYIYTIKGETFNERLESFFHAAMCLFNMQYSRENKGYGVEPLLFLLQLGEELLIPELDLEARRLIEQLVKYISELTLPSLDDLQHNHRTGLLIQSPLLFPNVYGVVSHMIYGVDKTRDFDLQDLIPGLSALNPNEAIYLSKVVLGNNQVFVKKVHLPIVLE